MLRSCPIVLQVLRRRAVNFERGEFPAKFLRFTRERSKGPRANLNRPRPLEIAEYRHRTGIFARDSLPDGRAAAERARALCAV